MKRARHAIRLSSILALVSLAACALALCAACSAGSGSGSADASAGSPTSGAQFTVPDHLTMPAVDASGPAIDASHSSEGYVVAHFASAARLKFQVSKGDQTYNYDLPNDDTPAVFSINMEDGAYVFRIMKNTDGNNYAEAERLEADVALTSEFAPYVIPNQYCNFDENSKCVAKAREITADAANQGEAVRDICEYVVEHVSYDTAKARQLSTATGYIPDPDDTLDTGTGVCFDYASLGAAMLRSVGLPAKIITGYVSPGDLYHAWIAVYIDGSWQTSEFSVSPDSWSRVDLTFAASGEAAPVGDGTSYTERYVY